MEIYRIYYLEPQKYKDELYQKLSNKHLNRYDSEVFVDSFYLYLHNKYGVARNFPKPLYYSLDDNKEFMRLLVKSFVKDSLKAKLAKEEMDSLLYSKK